MDDTGEHLFELVVAYERLGPHRTGSAVDHRTAEWFAEQLTRRGLTVQAELVPFDRWVTESSVVVDGEPVEHLPLQTPWVGEVRTSAPSIVLFDVRHGGFPEIVDAPLAVAASQGAAAIVLATDHARGSLVAVNRHPDATGTPAFPAVLVAGRDADRCRTGPLELHLRARYERAHTTNVVGHRPGAGPSVIVTTPLNGWFGCAGERGTGIAVLLELLDHLRDVDLTVVGTGGHELGYFGAHHHVARVASPPAAIVHLGASIAVEEHTDQGRRLAATRTAMTTLDGRRGAGLIDPLARARLELRVDADRWIGEGNAWGTLGVPLLSISGAGVDFHTPDDTAERVTSPASLALAADAVIAAVHELLVATGLR